MNGFSEFFHLNLEHKPLKNIFIVHLISQITPRETNRPILQFYCHRFNKCSTHSTGGQILQVTLITPNALHFIELGYCVQSSSVSRLLVPFHAQAYTEIH